MLIPIILFMESNPHFDFVITKQQINFDYCIVITNTNWFAKYAEQLITNVNFSNAFFPGVFFFFSRERAQVEYMPEAFCVLVLNQNDPIKFQ